VSHRPLLIFATSILAVSTAPAAYAQASTPASPSGQKPIARADIARELNTSYKNVDTNGDGAVVLSEIQAAQERSLKAAEVMYGKRRDAAFQKLDTNKDGQLSVAEFNAGSPSPPIAHPAPAAILQQLDANKDQKITQAEFGAIILANFDRADANHDGVVSPEEAAKARPAR
jgi:Ca2+-binding EF-hand superfamily protein